MRRINCNKAMTLMSVIIGIWFVWLPSAMALDETTLVAGRFGKVHIYRQSPQPSHFVLFVSGDGGWNLGVVDMARNLAELNALVVGIDIVHYLKHLGQSGGSCLYPAADFESLSKFVQKSLNYRQYVQPVLVGYSSGATLVYALICQAPANTFKGALSLGFCPDLPLAHPPCKGSGLAWGFGNKRGTYLFSPVKFLETPWTVLQGEIDRVCDAPTTKEFVSQIPGARMVMLPKVGHGFSVPRNWLPQFKAAFEQMIETTDPPVGGALGNLPLVEVSAHSSQRHQLAVLLSGDGGWAGIDRQLANELAARDLPVVGLNSLKYFWSQRTPESSALDLERIMNHYLRTWKKEQVVLIGYSLGADVLPFLIARLPAALRSRVTLIALLGPGQKTAFEFHLSDWIGHAGRAKQYPVLPEVKRLGNLRTLCFYGDQESDSLCREPLPASVTKVPLSGGHHFGGGYKAIADDILRVLGKAY
jgi:type IV secretory pathway VirJ component